MQRGAPRPHSGCVAGLVPGHSHPPRQGQLLASVRWARVNNRLPCPSHGAVGTERHRQRGVFCGCHGSAVKTRDTGRQSLWAPCAPPASAQTPGTACTDGSEITLAFCFHRSLWLRGHGVELGMGLAGQPQIFCFCCSPNRSPSLQSCPWKDLAVRLLFVQKQTKGESFSKHTKFCSWSRFHPHGFLFAEAAAPSCEPASRRAV